MSNRIEEHVNNLFKDIPHSKQRESIKQEIILNLEDKVQDLIADGKEEEDAINKAIIDFGDVDEIKNELIGKQKKSKAGIHLGYSIFGSLLIIALVLFINFYYSPEHIWFVYPTFLVLWWPMTMFFVWLSRKKWGGNCNWNLNSSLIHLE